MSLLQALKIKDSGRVVQAVGLVALTQATSEILQEEKGTGEWMDEKHRETFSSLLSVTKAGKVGDTPLSTMYAWRETGDRQNKHY